MIAGFSSEIMAEMDTVICCYESKIHPGMRENRAFAKKREGEGRCGHQDVVSGRREGLEGDLLDSGLLMRTVMPEILPYQRIKGMQYNECNASSRFPIFTS